eukprot:195787_1
MAQKQVNVVENEIISILKINGKGWNIKLFEDETKATTCLCASCDGVCCDAVELDCDHEDEDIYLYCKPCLSDLIKQNNNKCPINSHDEPTIISNRASRRQISKSLVICPYSSKYKSKQNIALNNNNHDHEIIDTIDGDEKEGMPYQQDNQHANNGCQWKGTLTDLINKHIVSCSKKYNPTFALNIRIKELENENKRLNVIVNDKDDDLKTKELIITQLQGQNQKLNMIHNVNEQTLSQKQAVINQQNSLLAELQNKLQNETTTIKLLKQQNEKLQTTIHDQEAIIKALTKKVIKTLNTVDVKHEEKKNDEIVTENRMRFFGNAAYFKIIDEKTIEYKSTWMYQGGIFCYFAYSSGNGICKTDDRFTAYFDISSKGNNYYYWFGFATKCVWSKDNKIAIDGAGNKDIGSEFKNNKELKTFQLLNTSLNENTIVFSVDMKKKIGCIWNAQKNSKITIKLPAPVVIIFGFGGTDGKILKLKKITFH